MARGIMILRPIMNLCIKLVQKPLFDSPMFCGRIITRLSELFTSGPVPGSEVERGFRLKNLRKKSFSLNIFMPYIVLRLTDFVMAFFTIFRVSPQRSDTQENSKKILMATGRYSKVNTTSVS
jgi:hypothetical protein